MQASSPRGHMLHQLYQMATAAEVAVEAEIKLLSRYSKALPCTARLAGPSLGLLRAEALQLLARALAGPQGLHRFCKDIWAPKALEMPAKALERGTLCQQRLAISAVAANLVKLLQKDSKDKGVPAALAGCRNCNIRDAAAEYVNNTPLLTVTAALRQLR